MAIPETTAPARMLRPGEAKTPKPIYAVWELTLKCDQPCTHCGSRAGRARESELTTAKVLEVADTLVRMGCREVALIGGEAYLRPDLPQIVEHLATSGLRVALQTGGRNFPIERARTLKDAGLSAVGVSIDGTARVHDRLRGNLGSHAAAMRALENARAAGLVVTSNAQINRHNYRVLWDMVRELWKRDVIAWQVALTVPMGRAADEPDFILEPYMVVEVIDTLAAIQLDAAERHAKAIAAGEKPGPPFNIFIGNNIGYYGPHETILRSRPGGKESYWQGCRAGQFVIGIESDGTVKGCPSLPTAPYDGGNLLDTPLEEIWQHSEKIRFTRDRSTDELWGFCKSCYYAEDCMAGCSWTAHCTLGRRGNNPFCYHRVKQLEKRGVRERLERTEAPPNAPYDFGRFTIVEEPLPDGVE